MARYAALLALVAAVQVAFAAPVQVQVQKRAISADIYNKLVFYSQYAAASYCQGNNNSTGTKITCPQGNCPLVEAADTTTVSEFENSLATDVTGFVAVDRTNKLIVLSFRGSRSLANWITDLSFVTTATTLCDDCLISSGFYASWEEARENVLAAIATARAQNPTFQVIATGHSLGAAVATIGAGALRGQGIDVDLYTYGSPKIGLAGVVSYMENSTLGTNYRVTHLNDPVPRLPPTWLDYRHTEPEYYISSNNTVFPTAEDVTVFTTSAEGNEVDSKSDDDAHGRYFGLISACKGDDSI